MVPGVSSRRAAWRIADGRREWSFADLEPAQLDLVDEAERTLDTDVVMAYAPSAWGTVDPDMIADEGLHPVELDASQLECLRASSGGRWGARGLSP